MKFIDVDSLPNFKSSINLKSYKLPMTRSIHKSKKRKSKFEKNKAAVKLENSLILR